MKKILIDLKLLLLWAVRYVLLLVLAVGPISIYFDFSALTIFIISFVLALFLGFIYHIELQGELREIEPRSPSSPNNP